MVKYANLDLISPPKSIHTSNYYLISCLLNTFEMEIVVNGDKKMVRYSIEANANEASSI